MIVIGAVFRKLQCNCNITIVTVCAIDKALTLKYVKDMVSILLLNSACSCLLFDYFHFLLLYICTLIYSTFVSQL